MLTSGFTNAPVSKFLVFYVVASALVASITDSQYLLWIQVVPHLWGHGQFWRVLTWQLCYANSTEVLFAAMTFYHLRVIERLWGSRKFASFLLSTLPYTTLLPPLLLALVVRPLTFNHANYLPGGLTPTLFALLAQYHAAIPQQYKYRLAAAGSTSSSADGSVALSPPSLSDASLTLSNKSWHYLLAIQLALSAVPGSLLAAAIGWAVGAAWRNEALPVPPSTWRLPGWMVGEHTKADGPEFESLRERMERERGSATGRDMGAGAAAGEGIEARRREGTLGGLLAGQFGGAER
ncbi:hypothetical protein IWX90DRAFT_399383 [Phyllosticta citrichinensis]|uniref:UBA domain-containing protein Ucp14 n=1 Tax=Phyllosticta citrichinensis TaxID=1130410 RepID=A0ABR1Y126_9PEZI